MTVKLNQEELQIDDDITINELIQRVRKNCLANKEVLIDIEISGEQIKQTKLDEIGDRKVGDREIKLHSADKGNISNELISKAIEYLDHLEVFLSEFDFQGEEDQINELSEVIQSFGWLNFALKEIKRNASEDIFISGQRLSKYQNDSFDFFAELKGALEKPDKNRQLLKTLINQDLSDWIEAYKMIFDELERRFEGELN